MSDQVREGWVTDGDDTDRPNHEFHIGFHPHADGVHVSTWQELGDNYGGVIIPWKEWRAMVEKVGQE